MQGGGEMGERIRSYNWESTGLGSPATWPQSLRTTLSILLHSKFPMFLFWGNELTCFYNDAYRPSFGATGKHPDALGQPGEMVWPEIWPVIKPLIDQVMAGGEANWTENNKEVIYRNGQLEETYWTYSYSAVYDEKNTVAGVFVTCMETTAHVNNLRAVQESKEQLQFAIEANELGTFDYNPVTNQFSANDRLKEWFGLPPEANMDLSVAITAIAPYDQERVSALIKNALVYENGGKYETIYTIITPKENTSYIVKAKGKVWFDENKTAYRLNGTLQDVTEEIKSLKKLEERENYFRQLTDTVPAIIWITNADGHCIYLNKNWYSYTGQTREEAESFGWLNTTHPDDAEQVATIFVNANARQIPFHITYRLRDSSGQYRWVIDSGSPKFDAGGTYEGMIGTVVDIHEQKLAEEKIRQSEARFRNLIAAAPAGIGLFVGRDLVIETPNQTFIDIVGKGPGVVGKPLREAMPELLTEGQPFLKILDDVYTSGQTFQTAGSLVKIVQNGVLKDNYYNISYTPLLDADGHTYAILDIAVDVTQQIMAQQKLVEAEERTRLAIEAAELGTYELNLLTNEMLTSARFNEIFDVHDTHDHSPFVNAFHPDDLAVREQAHKDSLQNGMLDYTARIIRQSGKVLWVRIRGRQYFDEAQKPIRLLGVVQDITEQKELERQKDSFLGIASHELKTPVTSMKAYAQLMEKIFRRSGDTKNAELVAKMNHQANRLSSLIADLLDVTKINNGRLQFNLTTFNFNAMVQEVVEDMQHTSPTHEIRMQLDFTGLVYGDRERTGQVLINLITNAIKYSPNTRHIVVYTQNKGTEVQLCVQDFGIGISADKKDLVFEQFYRVSGSKEHTFPGLGLGLYISSEIVKRMHGRIWVNSTEGKGSTFCFAVPVQQG